MKRFLSLFTFLTVCSYLMAGGISKQAAMKKAQAFLGSTAQMKLVAVDKEAQPSYYVFNAMRTNKGFVIVAGEEMGNDILGYAEGGEYDPVNMPPAMKYMLDCYAEQVAAVRSGKAEKYTAEVVYENITPLVKTNWDQNAPYNLSNPVNPTTDELFPYAGCVATAMAQIIKYWASSVPVSTIPSYSYYLSADGYSYSTTEKAGYSLFTVASLPSKTFNFDNMPEQLSYDTSDESIEDVAELIQYCARSVQMKFHNGGSSANALVKSFTDFWGYNSNAVEVLRNDYSAAQWDDMIYSELKNNRPVLYSGSSMSATGRSGHAFVCDGYKDGLFHINWGWNGKYDGYFKLSECNSRGEGSGSGNSKDGYSIAQKALIGLQPDNTAPLVNDKVWMKTKEMTCSSSSVLTRASADENFEIVLEYGVYNASEQKETFDHGVGIYKGNELVTTAVFRTNKSYDVNYGYKGEQTFSWGKNITEGTYLLRNVSRPAGTYTWIPNKYSDFKYLVMTINGNTMTISEPDASLAVENVDFEGILKTNKSIALKALITNNGPANSNAVLLYVDGKQATGVGVNVDPGESDVVPMHFTATTAGSHTLTLYQADQDYTTFFADPIWEGSIYIEQAQDADLSATTPTIANIDSKSRIISGTTAEMTIPIKNNDTKAFNDEITFRIYKLYDEVNVKGNKEGEKRLICNIEPGETQKVTVSFEELVPGKYWINTYFYQPSENALKRIYQTYMFEIEEAPTAVVKVEASPVDANAPFYNLNGQRVKNPRKGIFIQNGRKVVIK